MYQFLTLIGPGAFAFLLIHFFMKDKAVSVIDGVVQVIVLSLISNIVAIWFLMQFSKDVLILNGDGTSYVQYGPLDTVFVILVATLISFAIIIARKHVILNIKVEEKNE